MSGQFPLFGGSSLAGALGAASLFGSGTLSEWLAIQVPFPGQETLGSTRFEFVRIARVPVPFGGTRVSFGDPSVVRARVP